MKKSVLSICIILIVIIGGYFIFQQFYPNNSNTISQEFIAKFKETLPRDQKIQLTQELVFKKSEKTMYLIAQIFPDLEKSADISSQDPRSLTGKYAETWYYSKKDNITIVELADSKTPLYIFPQMNPPIRSVEGVQESMRGK